MRRHPEGTRRPQEERPAGDGHGVRQADDGPSTAPRELDGRLGRGRAARDPGVPRQVAGQRARDVVVDDVGACQTGSGDGIRRLSTLARR